MAFGSITERIRLLFDDDASEGFDQAGSKFGGMASTFKKAALAGGIAIAASQITQLGARAVQLAVDAEEAAAAFETTFGPATSQMSEFVEDFGHKAGFTSGELQQLLAVTGNVAQGMGFSEQASADLSTKMAELAGDVASFSNAAGGAPAVLAALQSALNGEREALKTYGLAVSEAEVQTKALAMTGKTSADELTRQEKALATLEVATGKAGKALGDLDRTQDSTANSLRRVQARLREAGTEIGQKLIPLVDKLLPQIESSLPGITAGIGGIAEAFAAVAPVIAKIMGLIPDVVSGFKLIGNQALVLDRNIAIAAKEIFSLGFANTEAEQAARDHYQAQSDLVVVTRELERGAFSTADAATNLANALDEMARRGSLTSEAIDDLTDSSEANAEEAIRAVRAALSVADAHGYTEEQVQALKEADAELRVEAGLVTDEYSETERMIARYGDATAAAAEVTEKDMSPAMVALRDRLSEAAKQAFETGQAMRQDLAEEIADSVDMIDGAVDEIDASLDELMSNYEESLNQQLDFYENLAILAGAGYEALAAELEAQGPQMAGAAADLVEDMDKAADWDMLIRNGTTAINNAADAFVTTLDNREATIAARFQAFGITMADALEMGFSTVDLNRTLDSLIDQAPGASTPTSGSTAPATSSGTPLVTEGGQIAFALGGVVPGGPSDEVPALLHGSEMVIPPAGSSAQASFVAALAAELRPALQGNSNGGGALEVRIQIDQDGRVVGATVEAQSENLATTVERLVRQ